MKMTKIFKPTDPLEFISFFRLFNSNTNTVEIYTKGKCYRFYKILLQIFPSAVPYYNSDHVITKIGKRFYDITGEIEQGSYQPLIEQQIIQDYENNN